MSEKRQMKEVKKQPWRTFDYEEREGKNAKTQREMKEISLRTRRMEICLRTRRMEICLRTRRMEICRNHSLKKMEGW
jgi:hypothetical protein